MAFEHKENSGSIFRNDDRTKDTHPTHRGSGKIDGTEYWISAWVNDLKNKDGKYLSLRFEPKGESKSSQTGGTPAPDDDWDDDIPF